MEILFLLVPAALMLSSVALVAFFWAAGDGQFEDPDGAACRILLEEDK